MAATVMSRVQLISILSSLNPQSDSVVAWARPSVGIQPAIPQFIALDQPNITHKANLPPPRIWFHAAWTKRIFPNQILVLGVWRAVLGNWTVFSSLQGKNKRSQRGQAEHVFCLWTYIQLNVLVSAGGGPWRKKSSRSWRPDKAHD